VFERRDRHVKATMCLIVRLRSDHSGRDADHDIFTALERRLEQGTAPEHLIATDCAAISDRQRLRRR
jgi:hypothetical protein